MRIRLLKALTLSLLLVLLTIAARAETAYAPPGLTAPLLGGVDFTKAVPVDETYRAEFQRCDTKGTFNGIALPKNRRCAGDPNRVKVLLKLADGAIYWESKMALDVDGAWAAWNGKPGATDQKFTSLKWPGAGGSDAQASQIDPDVVPFFVIPADGLKSLTGDKATALGREFAGKTGLTIGDFGVSDRVVFIGFPCTHTSDITPANILGKLCATAKALLTLTGGACP